MCLYDAQQHEPGVASIDLRKALKVCGASGLRHVAHALLEGADASSLRVGDGEKLPGNAVVASAEYIRDRVGVPRDLPYPAARQLRAHLNWLISSLTA